MTYKMAAGEDFKIVTKSGGEIQMPAEANSPLFNNTSAYSVGAEVYEGSVRYKCISTVAAPSSGVNPLPSADTSHWKKAPSILVLSENISRFAERYPDGSVRSEADFTEGIKYNEPDTVNRTITVKPFCSTGTAANDNSALAGCVVIPPFVDAQGNPYISDDGTRFKVVGVSSGTYNSNNTDLTAIVAPNTVTTIGSHAFDGCSSLTSVSLSAATGIGDSAFQRCSSLTSASLPAATDIGSGAFNGCTSLTSVLLPATTNILSFAFYGCTSLALVDFGATLSSVPSLDAAVFDNVPTSCKIIVPDSLYDQWIVALNWSTLYADGYKFLRHSEWEYARKYEVISAVQQIAPAWVDSTPYTKNALVTYNGAVYRCKENTVSPHTAAPDTDATHWETKPVSELFLGNNGNQTLNGDLSIVAEGGTNASFIDCFYKVSSNPLRCFKVGVSAGNTYINNYDKIIYLPYIDSSSDTFALVSQIYAAVQQIAPVWSKPASGQTGTTYTKDISLCTYNGVLYQCAKTYTTDSSSNPPPNDIYDSGHTDRHWVAKKVSDLFLPLTGGEMDVNAILNLNSSLIQLDSMFSLNYTGVSNGRASSLYRWPFLAKNSTFALLHNLADDFSTSATYAEDDLCVYNGRLYRCTTAIETAEAWNSEHWSEATVEDVLAAIRTTLDGKVSKSGGTMTGGLTVPNLTVGSRRSGSTVGAKSVAEGYLTTASDYYSHAEGYLTTASNLCSHAEGDSTTASGLRSHAEGDSTTASGPYSHAEGAGTTASGSSSHAEGYLTTAQNDSEHAQGKYNASHTGSTVSEKTRSSIGIGTASARKNAVEVMQDGKTYIYGLGGYDGTNPTDSTDLAAVVNGKANDADVLKNSGAQTLRGSLTVGSRVEGSTVGLNSVAEGFSITASGDYSHAEGGTTTASGDYSHAEGADTTASGYSSHAEGASTTAQNDYEHAQGRYNASHTVPDSSFGNAGNTLLSIGFGTATNARKNAVETMQNGKTYIYGLGGYDGTNPTGAGVKDLATAVYAAVQQIAPVWSKPASGQTGTTYTKDISLCTYNGVLYQCAKTYTTDSNSNPPPNDIHDGQHTSNHWVVKKVSDLFLPLTGGEMTGYLTVPNLTVGSREPGSTIGENSVAEGIDNTASGPFSHAEGTGCVASGDSAHAEGSGNTASGDYSHAEGGSTNASQSGAHAEGDENTASGPYSHAEGTLTEAYGYASHTEGLNTRAGDYAHAEGCNTTAQNQYEHAQGKYNASHTGSTDQEKTLSSIGFGTFGTAPNARKNAVETMQDGKTYIYGLGGYDGTNPTNSTDLAEVVNTKLDSSAAATPWSSTAAYDANSWVTYNGGLYRSKAGIAAPASGSENNDPATDTTNWTVEDMTTPDATLDVTAAKQLRVVSADGTVLWAQGYDLASTSSAALSSESVNKYDFAVNATDAVSLTLPTPLFGKVGDFVLDVTNPALDSTAASWATAFDATSTYAVGDVVSYNSQQWCCTTAVETSGEWTGSTNWDEAFPYFTLSGLGTLFSVVVPVNENLTDMLTFAPGDMAELYFTQTSFTVNNLPVWKVVRQDVEAAV